FLATSGPTAIDPSKPSRAKVCAPESYRKSPASRHNLAAGQQLDEVVKRTGMTTYSTQTWASLGKPGLAQGFQVNCRMLRTGPKSSQNRNAKARAKLASPYDRIPSHVRASHHHAAGRQNVVRNTVVRLASQGRFGPSDCLGKPSLIQAY